jgi:hypothetical protein
MSTCEGGYSFLKAALEMWNDSCGRNFLSAIFLDVIKNINFIQVFGRFFLLMCPTRKNLKALSLDFGVAKGYWNLAQVAHTNMTTL